MFAEDPSIFFEDFAQRVTALGIEVEKGGILDQPHEILFDDGSASFSSYSLLVRTSQFGDLAMGAIVTVDDAAYRVTREPLKSVDGVFSTVYLMKESSIPPYPGA